MRRFAGTAFIVAGAVSLSACGGDEGEPRTVVVTAPPGQTTPAPTTPPSDQTQPPPETPALPPLPEGVIAADGAYGMAVRSERYQGNDITVDDAVETPPWRFMTDCQAGECTVVMQRALESGGFKTLTLRPEEGRPNVYAARSTGKTDCAGIAQSLRADTDQRHSIKLSRPIERNGRPTAQRIDAYFTEETTSENACDNADASRASVSWRGTLSG